MTENRAVLAWLATACAWLLAADARAPVRAEALNPCEGITNELRVDTALHVLRLCEDGRVAIEYPVSLGRGGVGKRKEGDRRTPLGRYSLAAPRPSSSFGTFVLLGYPTAQQRKSGFTGGDVGLHGPPGPRLESAQPTTTLLRARSDWTDGCIALDSHREIEAIASWIKRKRARWIEIH
jgi:murein L,D-transpeptidase YafK